MTIETLALEGLILFTPPRYTDERGYFEELFHQKRFGDVGLPTEFVQDNLSFSQAGVIRGLHFQREPHAQGKLVRVLKGFVTDVVVDIRPDSPTYGQHEKVDLSEENGALLYVPSGFAHGFEAHEDTYFLYKCTTLYSREAEGGILYNDPALGIEWTINNPIVSPKDLILTPLVQLK